MRWSSGAARGPRYVTTDTTGTAKASTGPATEAAVLSEEVFLGIDTAKTKHVVSRFVLGEGAKPAEGMITATLLARVAKWRKAGAAVFCVYEAGPTGFALARQLVALGGKVRLAVVETLLAVVIIVRPKVAASPPWHLRCPHCAGFTLVRVGRLPHGPPVCTR